MFDKEFVKDILLQVYEATKKFLRDLNRFVLPMISQIPNTEWKN